jgi:TonB family protein
VAFDVLASGAVENVRIAESAGHRLLDDAAVALVLRVALLPPPPFDVGPTGRVTFTVPIRYALR